MLYMTWHLSSARRTDSELPRMVRRYPKDRNVESSGQPSKESSWSHVPLQVYNSYLSCPGNFPLKLSYMLQILCFLSSARAGRSSSRLRRYRLS